MRRIARWMIRLYPARWRERYGEELNALIEDASPGFASALNIAVAGLKMRVGSINPWVASAILASFGAACGLALTFALPERFIVRITVPPGEYQPALRHQITYVAGAEIEKDGKVQAIFSQRGSEFRILMFGPGATGMQVRIPAANRKEVRALTRGLPDHFVTWPDTRPGMGPGAGFGATRGGVYVPKKAPLVTERFGASRLLFTSAGFASGLLLAAAMFVRRPPATRLRRGSS